MLATFQSLPQELRDEVVSHLRDDKPSLISFSLTCHSVLPACQKALFRNLCVGLSPPGQPGQAIATNLPSVQSFLDIIKTVPKVSTSARSLELTFDFDFLGKHLDAPLAKLLDSFCLLTHFSLELPEYLPSYLLSSKLKSSIQHILRLPTLKHLQLFDVPLDIIPCDTSVKRLVFRIWDLESLQKPATALLSKGSQPHVGGPRSDGKIAPAIESLDLDLDEVDIRLGVNYVLNIPTLNLSKLKRLQLNIEDAKAYNEREHISRLLRACSSLQVLRFICSNYTISPPDEHGGRFEVEVGDLSPLDSLRVLVIRIHSSCYTRRLSELWTPFNWLLRLLRTLPESNCLEEITLHITVWKSLFVSLHLFSECIPWGKLAPLFTERFAQLKKVRLLLQPEAMSTLKAMVDREHPQAIKLENMGLLTIEEWDGDVYSRDPRWVRFIRFRDSF